MNFGNLSGFFQYYQEMIEQLTETASLYQKPPMEDLVKNLQISQSFAEMIPTFEYSQLLPEYTYISESIAKQFAEAINLPRVRFSDDIGNILKTSQLLHQQMLENQASFNRIHANLIQDLKPVLDTSESIQVIYDRIRLTELEAFSSIAELPAFSELGRNLLFSIKTPQLPDFGEGFLSELSILLTSIANSQVVQLDDDVILEFEVRFADHVSDIKQGRVTQEGIAQIIRDIILLLAIILSWHSLQSSYDSGRTLEETQQIIFQISEKQSNSLQTLEENTDELEPQLEIINENLELTNQHLDTLVDLGERLIPYAEQAGDSSEEVIILVTKHSSPIRAEPSKNGAIITRVYPNQLVEQLQREKDWVYVEYFDYTEGVPKTGWIYRWNLMLLKND